MGPGNVLKDLIEADVIPTVHLQEIFRQAAAEPIVTNAHAIVRGSSRIFPAGTKISFIWQAAATRR